MTVPATPSDPIASSSTLPTDIPPIKWFNTPPNSRGKPHPYELQAYALQNEGEKRKDYQCVEFWPWVGSDCPVHHGKRVDWSFWEGCVAFCCNKIVSVRKCSDQNPWEEIWTIRVPTENEVIFTVAWSYNPIDFHPILAFAGKKGIVYIVDAVTQKQLRTLIGHGDEIMSLKFHPSQPDILATTSMDKTTRIWNVRGSEPPYRPPHLLSQNYPMGDADEGNEAVAILAGEGPGGHKSLVVGCAFHPTRNLLATCGGDYVVKIWPFVIPPLAETYPVTPVGYRPKIIHFPLFSTGRLHIDLVDTIDWIRDDVLVSKARDVIIVWKWLGIERFFDNETSTQPRYFDYVQKSDYTDSHSFSIIATYPIASFNWYRRFSLHHEYDSDPDNPISETSNLLTVPMIVSPIESITNPHIYLFNPLLAKNGPPPPPITTLRVDKPDQDYELVDHSETPDTPHEEPNLPIVEDTELEISTPTSGLNLMSASLDRTMTNQFSRIMRPRSSQGQNEAGTGSFTPPLTPTSRKGKSKDKNKVETPNQPDGDVDASQVKSPTGPNESLNPWIINVPRADWREIMRKVMKYPTVVPNAPGSILSMTAVSPRGGKWIVAVGEREAVLVFKMKGE